MGGITVLLIADLLIIHRRSYAVGFRVAAIESAFRITMRRRLHRVVAMWFGGPAAGEYIAQDSSLKAPGFSE